MQILDALSRAIDHYPGGRPSVALRLDKSDEVFRKELSGRSPNHKLGVLDAAMAVRMCIEAGTPHAHDYATAVAAECGGRFEPVKAGESNASPVQRVSSLVRETSDVATVVIESMADGCISDNELAVIEREIAEAEAVLQQLRTSARANNAASKPIHLRAAA